MKPKITIVCPQCGKGYKIRSRVDGTSRCEHCGYCGPTTEFVTKE